MLLRWMLRGVVSLGYGTAACDCAGVSGGMSPGSPEWVLLHGDAPGVLRRHDPGLTYGPGLAMWIQPSVLEALVAPQDARGPVVSGADAAEPAVSNADEAAMLDESSTAAAATSCHRCSHIFENGSMPAVSAAARCAATAASGRPSPQGAGLALSPGGNATGCRQYNGIDITAGLSSPLGAGVSAPPGAGVTRAPAVVASDAPRAAGEVVEGCIMRVQGRGSTRRTWANTRA